MVSRPSRAGRSAIGDLYFLQYLRTRHRAAPHTASSRSRPPGGWDGKGSDSMGASDSATASLEVRVLGTFRFWAEGTALPAVLGGSQRLLALLGLRDRALMRASVAGTLWPESTEEHAYSSLRSALGRLSRLTRDRGGGDPARPVPGRRRHRRHPRVTRARPSPARSRRDARPRPTSARNAIAALSLDVLPDWYDDWVLVEAEEWRQLRLHALDALADRLLTERPLRRSDRCRARRGASRATARKRARAGDPRAPRRGQPVRSPGGVRAVSHAPPGRARPRTHSATARARRRSPTAVTAGSWRRCVWSVHAQPPDRTSHHPGMGRSRVRRSRCERRSASPATSRLASSARSRSLSPTPSWSWSTSWLQGIVERGDTVD